MVKNNFLAILFFRSMHFQFLHNRMMNVDFEEYVIRKGSGFTKEFVWNKMHDTNPKSGAVLFAENNRHIILMHAHDETEELVPEYYKQFIDHLLENGLVFDEPKFL